MRTLMRQTCLTAVLILGVCVLWSCQSTQDLPEGQRGFSSPEEAVDGLLSVIRADDTPGLLAIVGPEGADLVDSGDPVDDRNRRLEFLALCEEGMEVERDGDDTAVLYTGAEQWPFPVPIVKEGDVWFFDAVEGAEEIVDRRIGRNELSTIQVCLAVANAQAEYARQDRDGDGVLEYARSFSSTPGKRDGLYWPTAEGEALSPLGELVAAAARDRYDVPDDGPTSIVAKPFHGYHFALLEAQGRHAVGGAYEYTAGEHMIGGWAMVAWPAEYGASGIKTFMINHDEIIYERDLGPPTAATASAMTAFDPDLSWTPVPESALSWSEPGS